MPEDLVRRKRQPTKSMAQVGWGGTSFLAAAAKAMTDLQVRKSGMGQQRHDLLTAYTTAAILCVVRPGRILSLFFPSQSVPKTAVSHVTGLLYWLVTSDNRMRGATLAGFYLLHRGTPVESLQLELCKTNKPPALGFHPPASNSHFIGDFMAASFAQGSAN